MDNFLKLIEQITKIENDEDLETYKFLIKNLKNNTELINDYKRECRLMKKTTTDIIAEKEDFLASIRKLIGENPDLTLQKKELLTEFLVVISSIIEESVIDLYRDYVQIPFTCCRENVRIPTYAHSNDAGFDFYLPEDFIIKAHEYGKIAPTGLKMSIPAGYELQIRPRSGNSVKTTLRIANAPGTIDSGYCDEIGIICDNIGDKDLIFKAGDRIAQGVISPVPKGIFSLVENITNISETNRGGGFGSTGK